MTNLMQHFDKYFVLLGSATYPWLVACSNMKAELNEPYMICIKARSIFS